MGAKLLKYLITFFGLMFIYNYNFKLNRDKSRTTTIIKSGTLDMRVDNRTVDIEGYGLSYPVTFDISLYLAIYGRKQITQDYFMPVDFFKADFLESKIGQMIEYPDYNFYVNKKMGDCYQIKIEGIDVLNIKKSLIKSLVCPLDDDLGVRKLDISGKFKSFNFKAGFDRIAGYN